MLSSRRRLLSNALVRRSMKRCVSSFVQRIGELVFDGARARAEIVGVIDPIGAVCRVGPCAHMGEPLLQHVEIALRAIELLELGGDPFARDAALGRKNITGDAARRAARALPARSCGNPGAGTPPTAGARRCSERTSAVSSRVVDEALAALLHHRRREPAPAPALRRRVPAIRRSAASGIETQIGVAPLNARQPARIRGFRRAAIRSSSKARAFAGYAERAVAR